MKLLTILIITALVIAGCTSRQKLTEEMQDIPDSVENKYLELSNKFQDKHGAQMKFCSLKENNIERVYLVGTTNICSGFYCETGSSYEYYYFDKSGNELDSHDVFGDEDPFPDCFVYKYSKPDIGKQIERENTESTVVIAAFFTFLVIILLVLYSIPEVR